MIGPKQFLRQFVVWVNETELVALKFDYLNSSSSSEPDALFPFKRLVSVTSSDQSSTYLYDQINGTTFAEEQWDSSVNQWLPFSYIIVTQL